MPSHRIPRPLLVVVAAAWLVGLGTLEAQEERTFTDEQKSFFQNEVRPILEAKCLSCHGASGKVKGGLNMTTREGLLQGGDLGPAIDDEEPEASVLVEAINYAGPEMPPKGKLPQPEIDVLTKWVGMGAPFDVDTKPGAAAKEERGLKVTDEHRRHWSFRPVTRPDVPGVGRRDWVRNPIDAFVAKKLEDHGLEPAAEADRVSLLRRVTLDLTGLPASPEEVAAFVADEAPDAYERRVDALLASPHYGERWGRHWLDVVRFAETNSFERDSDKPFSWRYRDYVIGSFNADKPFDQFIREQLAGDELDNPTAETITGTGFYRLGAWDDEPTDKEQAIFDELDDIVTTTSQAFLGLTLNCARCHDHKIDPVPQRDYYRMVAFFRNLKPFSYDVSHVLTDISSPEQRTAHAAVATEQLRAEEAILAELKPLEEKMLEQVVEPRRARLRAQKDFDRRKHVYDDLAPRVLTAEELDRYRGLIDRWQGRPKADPLPQALSAREFGPTAPETFLLIRGSAAAPGDRVEPGYPEVISGVDPVIPTSDPGAMTSGRRRVLADWIASPENPLTARVVANRIWQHHFGRGIVRTPNDFGLQGTKPTHPELLDWLASELVAQGWRMAPIHRLIVTSSAYRMSSLGNAEAMAKDPQNDLLWRFDLRRMGAEEVRDGILAVSGRLRSKMGGPGVYPNIPDAYLAGQSVPGLGWGDSPEEDADRRSVYVHVKRSLPLPILASFDLADADFTCPVRFATTQPTQALSTLNGEFLNEEAAHLAVRLKSECGDDLGARVRRGLALVTGRQPTAEEIARGASYVEAAQREDGLAPEKAFELYCLLLLNLNEFMYVD